MSNPHNCAGADPGRIVIISASVGAGHDGAAAELARRLIARGLRVDRHDFLDLLPAGLGRAVRGGYRHMLTYAPWGYQRIYAATERVGGGGRSVDAILRAAERRMLRVLPPDTRAVVSTYPLASQVVGSLRRAGRVEVPAFTYLTDFSVHAMWVADGIDAHFAAHRIPAAQATANGAARAMATGPLVDPRFTPATPDQRAAARARFELPEQAALALLVAGSWGVGPVERAALEIRDSGAAVPVVVCGRNQALADRLRSRGVPHAFGWVDDMPGLMHAADVLVQNAGGLTSLEAFASGLPVASYGCLPGHGRTNAAALDEAGLAVWIRSTADLKPLLTELLDGPAGRRQRAAGLALFAAHGEDEGPIGVLLAAARESGSAQQAVTAAAAAHTAAALTAPVIPAPRAAADDRTVSDKPDPGSPVHGSAALAAVPVRVARLTAEAAASGPALLPGAGGGIAAKTSAEGATASGGAEPLFRRNRRPASRRRIALALVAALATGLAVGPETAEVAVARGGLHLLHALHH